MILKVPGVYGDRFGPSEAEEKKTKGAEGVNVTEGIQGQSARIFCGGIAERKGCLAVGIFMNSYGEKKYGYFNDPFGNIQGHRLNPLINRRM
jgi:hypothetical protein